MKLPFLLSAVTWFLTAYSQREHQSDDPSALLMTSFDSQMLITEKRVAFVLEDRRRAPADDGCFDPDRPPAPPPRPQLPPLLGP